MREYHGDFETHVTVQTADAAALARFRDWCQQHGCKCVQIVLARGAHVDQPMATWRRRETDLSAVLIEARALVDDLNGHGCLVVRLKVEAAPGNRDVPQDDGSAIDADPGCYFEHHVKLLLPAAAPRDVLVQTCELHGAHLSRNAFREAAGGLEERFVTLRGYRGGRTTAERQLQQLLAALQALGEQIVEHESEYCVYDSNLALDAGWLPTVAERNGGTA